MNNAQYNELKTGMRQLVRAAKEVIEVIEGESPDDIFLSDIVCEEMPDLLEKLSGIFRLG